MFAVLRERAGRRAVARAVGAAAVTAICAVASILVASMALAATPAAKKAPPGGSTPSTKKTSAATMTDRTAPPTLPPAPPLHLPKPVVVTLANGLELAVVENHQAPVVDVTLLVRAGAVRDPADLAGLATFTAGMLDEGAGKRTSPQIAEEVEYLGAELSASAGLEAAIVSLHVPRHGLEAGLDLFADVALRPTFPDSEIVRQRELRRASLLQLRDQPNAIAPVAFNGVLFGPSHPYGRPQNGDDASTEKLDRARVVAFYEQYYAPADSRMLFVGDITPDEAKKLAEARFGSWSGKTPPPLAAVTPPVPVARAFYIVDKPDAPQSVIRIGNVGVERATPDFYAIQVMNTLLGGAFTSRLNQNLREKHGYTYGASSQFEMRRLAGPFRASAAVATAKTDSAVVEFLYELRRIRDAAPPEDEIKKTQQYLTLGLPGEFEATSDAAQRFLDLLVNDLPLDTWDRYTAGIQAVTAADVQRVARKYIDPDHFVMVVVGDRKAIEPGLRGLAEGDVNVRDLWGHTQRP